MVASRLTDLGIINFGGSGNCFCQVSESLTPFSKLQATCLLLGRQLKAFCVLCETLGTGTFKRAGSF